MKLQPAIKAWLVQQGRPCTSREIQMGTGSKGRQIGAALSGMVRRGWLVRSGTDRMNYRYAAHPGGVQVLPKDLDNTGRACTSCKQVNPPCGFRLGETWCAQCARAYQRSRYSAANEDECERFLKPVPADPRTSEQKQLARVQSAWRYPVEPAQLRWAA